MADALLDDLDDLSDVEKEVDPSHEEKYSEESNNNDYAGTDILLNIGAENDTLPEGGENGRQRNARRPRLLDDVAFNEHLLEVRKIKERDRFKMKDESHDVSNYNGYDKEDDEHQHSLILSSNKHLVTLEQEIHRTYLELCYLYNPKFPELEELLMDPFQYRAAIGVIQNIMDVTHVNDKLANFLTSNQIITISVAGSTTSGRLLSENELSQVNQTCDYLDQLRTTKNELTSFVESHMERWAPSVCALIGPSLAAQILGSTGGLAELCRIPACNLQLLGRVRTTSSSRGGLATQSRTQHAGWLMECDLVQSCPNFLKMRALKAVAGKLALVARSDYVNCESGRKRTAEAGAKFHADLRQKFSKWEEPDKAQVVKALPKPDLTTKKRRGGKRIRRIKEHFEETELMKQANKRAFSIETGEYGDDAMGLTLGMLDTKEGGAIRHTMEKRKMSQVNTKASRKRAIQMSSGVTNGLASSMVFTPVQGLELVNPDANRERVRQANAKWFSENAGFQSALPKK